MKKNKKIKNKLFIILLITIYLIITFLTLYKDNQNSKEQNYSITDYEANLNIQKSGEINVLEKITVNFENHNEYKTLTLFLPTEMKYKDNKGKEKTTSTNIYDISSTTDLIKTSKSNNEIKVTFGNEKTFINGTHTFFLKYNYKLSKDFDKTTDEFIFENFASNLKVPINNATFKIETPENIDEKSVEFFNKKTEIENNLKSIKVEENKVNISAKELLGKTIVRIDFPNNFFENQKLIKRNSAMSIFSLNIIIMIIVIILWKKYGKNFPKGIEEIEQSSPEGLDPAEIRYIYKNEDDRKQIVSLVISLAIKKYIKIIYTSDVIVIRKLIERKNKNKKNRNLSENEKVLYDILFEKEDIIKLSKNISKKSKVICNSIFYNFEYGINDKKSKECQEISYILLLISALNANFAFFTLHDLDEKFKILYAFMYITTFITSIFAILMKRKTIYGETIVAKVNGFKKYISNFDIAFLEKYKKKSKQYFYSIMPYAYAFDDLNELIEKLEKYSKTKWNIGEYNFLSKKYIKKLESYFE